MSANLRFTHRLAVDGDGPALTLLMEAAIRELLQPFLSEAQLEASFEIMGLDSQLIADGTYFIVEESGRIAGCGGWSRRATHFGGDHSPGRDARPLDPATEPARVRAMFTNPDFARRGVGRLILSLCEACAAEAGYRSVELVATMAGLPLYHACGYADVESLEERSSKGVTVPLLRMRKAL